MKLTRLYHHYLNWEDFQSGMWRIMSAEEDRVLLPKAIALTGDVKLYGSYMQRVIIEWPIGCEQNLSNVSMNRLAWVGHAACCLAINCPEYLTRQAWGCLTQRQRDEANLEAKSAVDEWVFRHLSRNQLLLPFVNANANGKTETEQAA